MNNARDRQPLDYAGLVLEFVGGEHHRSLFRRLRTDHWTNAVERLTGFEKAHSRRIDAFAGLGLSGAIPAAILANQMERGFLYVRRPGEKRFVDAYGSSSRTRGAIGLWPSRKLRTGQRPAYVIVDDLIESGRTALRCMRTIDEIGGTVVAIALYDTTAPNGIDDDFRGIPIIII